MTIYALKTRFQELLRPSVRWIFARGITANQVTVFAWAISVAIGLALWHAPRFCFAAVPIWMLVRMALNAVDGMLAREFGQKSVLGAYLNEISDVVSDAALYLPFAFVVPFDWRSVGTVILASVISEMTGVVAVMTGASRRYDGPMGKSDRAFVFSVLATWVAASITLPGWAAWLMWGVALLTTMTIVNRIRGGIRELQKEGTVQSSTSPHNHDESAY